MLNSIKRTTEEHSRLNNAQIDQQGQFSQDHQDGEQDEEAQTPGHSSISTTREGGRNKSFRVPKSKHTQIHQRGPRPETKQRVSLPRIRSCSKSHRLLLLLCYRIVKIRGTCENVRIKPVVGLRRAIAIFYVQWRDILAIRRRHFFLLPR